MCSVATHGAGLHQVSTFCESLIFWERKRFNCVKCRRECATVSSVRLRARPPAPACAPSLLPWASWLPACLLRPCSERGVARKDWPAERLVVSEPQFLISEVEGCYCNAVHAHRCCILGVSRPVQVFASSCWCSDYCQSMSRLAALLVKPKSCVCGRCSAKGNGFAISSANLPCNASTSSMAQWNESGARYPAQLYPGVPRREVQSWLCRRLCVDEYRCRVTHACACNTHTVYG